MNFKEVLKKYSPVEIDNLQLDKFDSFYNFIEKNNENINLTSINGYMESAILNFVDSLYIFKTGKINGKILDVGSGGGFPAVPAAIYSGKTVTALDSTMKKLNFIKEASGLLDLNVEILHGRAEEISKEDEYRESFDTVVSRGVSKMNVLCELCLPFLKTGGYFIAMKGSGCKNEVEEAEYSIKALGGVIYEIYSYNLPVYDRSYNLAVIKKIYETPAVYPRKYSSIIKKPL